MLIKEYLKCFDDIEIERHNLNSYKNQSFSIVKSIDEIKSKLSTLPINKLQRIEKERKELLSKTLQDALYPYREKLKELEIKSRELEGEKELRLGSITESEIKKNYSKEYLGLENLEEVLQELEELFVKVFGRRLYGLMKKRVSTADIDQLDLIQIKSFIRDYNFMKKEVKPLANHNEIELDRYLEYIFFDYNKLGNISNKNAIYSAYIFLLLALLLTFNVFTVIPLFLGIIGVTVYNFLNMSKLYSYCSSFMFMNNNMEKLFDKLDKNVKKLMQEEKDAINAEYNTLNTDVRIELTKIENMIEDKTDEIKESFDFSIHEKEIEEEFKRREQEYSASLQNAEYQYGKSKEKISESEQTINTLEEKLITLKKEIELSYLDLSRIKGNKILQSDFLIGFEGKDINVFNFKKESMCIIYERENYETALNILRLILLQSYNYLSSHLIRTILIDNFNMGKEFLQFQGPETDVFEVVSKDNEIEPKLKDFSEEIANYFKTSLREFETIDRYNEYMIELDSLTLEYQWIIFLKYSVGLLSKDAFIQLLRVGDTCGMYPIVLVSKEEINKEKVDKNYGSLFENVKNIYELSGERLQLTDRSYFLNLNYGG